MFALIRVQYDSRQKTLNDNNKIFKKNGFDIFMVA